MKLKYQQGSAVVVVIIVIVVAVLGWVGFVFWQNYMDTSNGNDTTEVTQTDPYSQVYTSSVGFFSIHYPDSWTQGDEKQTLDENGAVIDESTTLTSPSGTVVSISADPGYGRGGTCEPAETEVAFAAGNQCPSWEYLSVQKLPIKDVYYNTGKITFDYATADVLFVTVHYGDTDGANKYLAGLVAVDPDSEFYPTVDGPRMGVYYPDLQLSNYKDPVDGEQADTFAHVGIYASSDDAAFLQSSDIDTFRSIARTFTVEP